ncbi:Crp/Fnr family transcriptional regulator [Stappia sp. BW2]|jgi:CRP-like cAMP-binding protein|uniref:Crp/Fnr family transcriptional regulator n=1 Tax=Stappia sp. BW2 TaxID=2592622 RepID=UPI0011DEF19B|nr:Crp/Fnr family transcriptional regulator [Stappia sp. BW2]TYC67874.1 Crp/Fnr family transcriptional regulator [Stappia sp. BW2]
MAADESLNKEKLLGQSFIFEALDEQSRKDLAAFAHVKRYTAGDVIFDMGTPGQSMMAIAEGSVRITMTTPSARDVTLSELHAGDIFGEIALLDGGERSANARALTNCKLVVLERRSLLEVLNRDPALSIRVIELLCKRVRRSDERMMEIGFLGLPERLARLLLRITVTAPGSEEKPLTKLSLSQSEIAEMIGNTRETVNRCLRKFQKAELIEIRDGWLIIRNREGLEDVADSV